jgi:hypothetical protein
MPHTGTFTITFIMNIISGSIPSHETEGALSLAPYCQTLAALEEIYDPADKLAQHGTKSSLLG